MKLSRLTLCLLQAWRQQAVLERPGVSRAEQKLEAEGVFHLGDQINRFESGSLNLPVRDGDDGPVIATTIFGTVSGRIGVIAGISAPTFATLSPSSTSDCLCEKFS